MATAPRTAKRYDSWAELMRRVFAIDMMECPRSQATMKILAPIHPPDTKRQILLCLGHDPTGNSRCFPIPMRQRHWTDDTRPQ